MTTRSLNETYENYREQAITQRRFSPELVQQLLAKLPSAFKVEEIGKSAEGRAISLVKIGKGSKKILFWSQMHGDESTATAALFDMFNFFGSMYSSISELNFLKDEILKHSTLYFVPMLNPDGALHWTRRNSQQIDLNRDALALQAPESRILKDLQQRILPDFGFNLHDQNNYYTAGNQPTPSTIAFLAPPIDYAKTINLTRQQAMQVIGRLAGELQEFIPQGIAKFTDDFEPRAFGDNMQRWGTSTILVESGALAGDAEKQTIRKLNFILLMRATELIARNEYSTTNLQAYHQIPTNEKLLKDVILRNVQHPTYPNTRIDLAFNRSATPLAPAAQGLPAFAEEGSIDDIGDLSIYFGYETLDCTNYQINYTGTLAVGQNPTLFIKDAQNQVVATVENGFLKRNL